MGVGNVVAALLGVSFLFSGLVILVGWLERPRAQAKAAQEPTAPGPSAAASKTPEPRLEAVARPERSALVLPGRQQGVIYTPRAIDPDSCLTSVCCCKRRAWCQMGPGYPPMAGREAERVARLLRKLGKGG